MFTDFFIVYHIFYGFSRAFALFLQLFTKNFKYFNGMILQPLH